KLTDGCEVDPASDADNCGGCRLACSTSHVQRVCSGGSCETGLCDNGFADCNHDKRSDGCEVDVGGDTQNCGACGDACSSNHIPAPACTGAVCGGDCATGYADCNGDKRADGCEVNLLTDAGNCSACGAACPATASCQSGACVCPSGQA